MEHVAKNKDLKNEKIKATNTHLHIFTELEKFVLNINNLRDYAKFFIKVMENNTCMY